MQYTILIIVIVQLLCPWHALCDDMIIERVQCDGRDVAQALNYQIEKFSIALPRKQVPTPGSGYMANFYVEEYGTNKETPRIWTKSELGIGNGGSGNFLIKFPGQQARQFNLLITGFSSEKDSGVYTGSFGEPDFKVEDPEGAVAWIFLDKEAAPVGKDFVLGVRIEGGYTPEAKSLADLVTICAKSGEHRLLVFKCKIEEIHPPK